MDIQKWIYKIGYTKLDVQNWVYRIGRKNRIGTIADKEDQRNNIGYTTSGIQDRIDKIG